MTDEDDSAAFVYSQRVRPQECAASTMLGHPRYLEFFEAAFIECWRERFGALDISLGRARALTVAAVDVRYLAPVRADDDLRVEVRLESLSERSVRACYDAWVGPTQIARASTCYVCLNSNTGLPAPLPAHIAAL